MRRPCWSSGRPSIDKLVIRAIPDPRTLTASMLSNEVDISTFVEHSDVPLFKKNSKFAAAVVPGIVTGYMGLNAAGSTGRRALSDVRLRQAACHAINKKKLIQLALFGYGAVGAGICPPATVPISSMISCWQPKSKGSASCPSITAGRSFTGVAPAVRVSDPRILKS